MRKVCSIVLIAALALAAGCGKKGPLYLRDSPPPGVKPPKTYKPVPYPPEPTEEEKK